MAAPSPGRRADQLALLASLALVVWNVASTGRWADVPGSLRGWRWPFVLLAVLLAAVPAVRRVRSAWTCPAWLPRVLLIAGFAAVAGSFLFEWFPISTWRLIPFTDDWPPRFSSTVEGLSLLRRGAFVGWDWHLLGGYATATDITQSLTLLGAIPMTLFGNAVGFHLLHLLLFLALPTLVYLDLRLSEARRVSMLSSGLVALTTCSLAWGIARSGDSNSLAGLCSVFAVLLASHRRRAGRRYGFSVLVVALTVAAYSHVGFFAYAVGLLLVESTYYRDWRHARYSLGAAAVALAASLPLTYELFRYPGQFNFNNVLYARPAHVDWAGILRKVGYNVQINFEPWRWFSDVTRLFAPVVLLAAWRRQGRVGFFAWATVAVVALGFFDVPEAGYFFARPQQLLALFAPIILASFVVERSASGGQAAGVLGIAVLLVPFINVRVPHERSVEDFAPALVDRLRGLDGNLVLVENNPHRDVDATSARSEKSLYGTHYEALLPDATGKRLYAGYWDGWQWTPFRGEMLAGGAWEGHLLSDADHGAFIAEMRRWGIRHLLVWSKTATSVLAQWPEFETRWRSDPWREFELTAPPVDTRSVVVDHGAGELDSTDPLGGVVRLSGVQRGDLVVVRTHFHPAWQVLAGGDRLETRPADGQLAFVAPSTGTYDVTLVYPARRWLLVVAGLLLVGVIAGERRSLRPAHAGRRSATS